MTHLLDRVQECDPRAAGELLPLVYQELRKLAAHRMANEAPSQTLQPTALVHEAWLKMAGQNNPRYESRAHFFAAAAEAMRRILIDTVRRERASRHGGGQERANIQDVDPAANAKDDELLAVADALEKLAAQDERMAELVKLRFISWFQCFWRLLLRLSS